MDFEKKKIALKIKDKNKTKAGDGIIEMFLMCTLRRMVYPTYY